MLNTEEYQKLKAGSGQGRDLHPLINEIWIKTPNLLQQIKEMYKYSLMWINSMEHFLFFLRLFAVGHLQVLFGTYKENVMKL